MQKHVWRCARVGSGLAGDGQRIIASLSVYVYLRAFQSAWPAIRHARLRDGGIVREEQHSAGRRGVCV